MATKLNIKQTIVIFHHKKNHYNDLLTDNLTKKLFEW